MPTLLNDPLELQRPTDHVRPSSPRVADPCVVVMFGASGDLAMRKLVPALYNLRTDGLLSDHFRLVGVGRDAISLEHYQQKVAADIQRFGPQPIDESRASWLVNHVQITVAETVGVEQRGGYYDSSGALRDMVQNHLFQLLAVTTMEPPSSFEAEPVRDERLKVLEAIRPYSEESARHDVVRGQYVGGRVAGQAVPGYLNEPKIAPDSQTESFVALKVLIDNWRWADVPFYLRTGKRLPSRVTEIAIQFKGAFTENESNRERLFGVLGPGYVKDGINNAVVDGCVEAINPDLRGTKGSAHVHAMVPAGGQLRMRLRLTDKEQRLWRDGPFGSEFSSTFQFRRDEADAFYAQLAPASDSEEARRVMRQAFAGLLWSKQYYHYVVKDWLDGDPNHPPPPIDRRRRNADWTHLYAADVISMPDKWEYPWYAAWDLAFHCVPLALVDSEFAKAQLVLMLREWYMHPNGQLSAYEWAFGDVNPPVHAWAAWRVYKIEKRRRGVGDRAFLERVFQKLLLNFTWWVNRKDAEGRNVFEGGFLGLDNIGVFNRSEDLPSGGRLEQSDGTSWMAMYSLNMMAIALELADGNPAFEDMASKFWEHFLYIAKAMRYRGGQEGLALWNEEDGFFYDVLHLPDGRGLPIKVRSMVGLIPLLAVETLEPEHLRRLPAFKRRLEWFVGNRPDLTTGVTTKTTNDTGERRLLSILDPERLRRVLEVMLDEREFLSPYGVRALSRIHREQPYVVTIDGSQHRVDYEPGESLTGLFGGNSNWRGPVWFPVNFLLIESLQKFHHHLGDEFTVECPTGSGRYLTLWEVAADLSRRLLRLFVRDEAGRRASVGNVDLFQRDPHWRDLLLFHEYFHADTGAGLGASHQTGWTGLVAKLLQQTDVN